MKNKDLSIHFKELILDKKTTFRQLMSLCMVFSGISHFIILEQYIAIIPEFLPDPATIVYVSGVLEILGGVGLLIPQVSLFAAWGLGWVFIAICIASIDMIVANTPLTTIPMNLWLQISILPLQFVLILWAWWLSQPDRQQETQLAKNKKK